MTGIADVTMRDVRIYELGWDDAVAYADRPCRQCVEWQAWLGVYRGVVAYPRHAELEAARQFTPGEPCAQKCRRCSKCVHAVAYWFRGRRDSPGDGAA